MGGPELARPLRLGVERHAVEVMQARDTALWRYIDLVRMHEDVDRVIEEATRHLVGGDLVGLLHPRFALL